MAIVPRESIMQTVYKLFKTFRRSTVAKHSFSAGAAQALGAGQVGAQGSADQFMMKGVGFGGRTLFPYRSGMASSFDRQGRISLYIEEDFDPYANNALDIIADFVCDEDESGNILTVDCDDEKIRSILESLYYDVLNIDSRVWSLTRGLAKFGDYFSLINWHPKHGVMDAYPLPVHEVEREEGFDEQDPMAIRFKWTTHPHRKLQNFEMLHFRLYGNDALLPYGTSVLEASRRSFQQYLMMFDAMMIYRLVRAPERLVFFIEVGNTKPEDVEQYLDEQKGKLKSAMLADSSNSILDQRYDPITVMEDYWIPKRGDMSSRIEQLPGGTIQGDTEDIEVAINRYISGLKVPKPYLDYSEEWAKANIANLDIRFSKTIRRIQSSVIEELTKLGLIHLMTMGYEGNELFEWNLKMSNPSTIAELQKLEMLEKKINIISSAKGTEIFSTEWSMDEILGLSDQDKIKMEKGLIKDKMREQLREKAAEKFAARYDEPEETAEEKPAAEEEAGGEPKEEGQSAYAIPQEVDPDMSMPDTDEQLKRTLPNDGDGLEDPYDRDWMKKTAINIVEDENGDALEEASRFAFKKTGQIIVGNAPEKATNVVVPKTLQSRLVSEIKRGMSVKGAEILEHEQSVYIDYENDEEPLLVD